MYNQIRHLKHVHFLSYLPFCRTKHHPRNIQNSIFAIASVLSSTYTRLSIKSTLLKYVTKLKPYSTYRIPCWQCVIILMEFLVKREREVVSLSYIIDHLVKKRYWKIHQGFWETRGGEMGSQIRNFIIICEKCPATKQKHRRKGIVLI